ncbi:MAG: MBG domain-containing protein, partial [Clostridiales bacterium]|nr:MBG domain-containing protein [Clostridiales bacterium]
MNYLFEEVTYGGSNDLWGLSSLSIETVTSSSFGVGISIINAADSSSGISAAFVDDIKIKLYYTVASLITPDLSLSEPASATYDGQPHAAIVTSTIEGSVTDIRYDGSADAPVQAGSYSVTADFTPVDTSTYE